jgi:hypothetical protein
LNKSNQIFKHQIPVTITLLPRTTQNKTIIMPFRRSVPKQIVTEETHPTFMSRLRGRNANTQTVKTTRTIQPNGTTGTTAPVHSGRNHNTRVRKQHHFGRDAAIGGGVGVAGYEAEKHHKNKRARRGAGGVGNGAVARRHVSMGDKISGAMMKLKGSILHRPGVKAAGTRRMHGTDGRGSHRNY